MNTNHNFTPEQKADYDSLNWRGRDLYDSLRWYEGATHEQAFEAGLNTYGLKPKPPERPRTSDLDLPGMWEAADFEYGETDAERDALARIIRPWTTCDDGGKFDHGAERAAAAVLAAGYRKA